MPKSFEERYPESAAVKGERRQIARAEHGMRRRVLALLRGGAKTVPEVASALGISAYEAHWWMMGYVRYGFVRATEEVTEEGYYKYAIVEGKE